MEKKAKDYLRILKSGYYDYRVFNQAIELIEFELDHREKLQYQNYEIGYKLLEMERIVGGIENLITNGKLTIDKELLKHNIYVERWYEKLIENKGK